MVPLTMPTTRSTGSPTSDSRRGRMRGTAPPTAASNSRSTPASSAAANSSAPWAASSSLLAVTTGLPSSRARPTKARAGSMPPMTSTTASMSSPATAASASAVKTDGSIPRPRRRSGERTAMRAMLKSIPVRAAIGPRRSSSRRTNAAPTTPQPKSPTRI